MKKLQNIGRIGRFFSAGETLSGPDALAGLTRMQVNRAAVIVSPSVQARHDTYIQKCLSRFSTTTLMPPKGEPTLEAAHGLAARLHDTSPDVIIAIGGGSVIDIAKLAWILYEKPEIEFSDTRNTFPVSNLRSNISGFIAVPTTYGSGSENSSATVFQRMSGEHKNFVSGPELVPDIAILDPILATDLPIFVAAFAVMDTLAHTIEGYVSKYSNAPVRQMAVGNLASLREKIDNKPFADMIADPNDVNDLLTAGSFAGIIQNIANPGLAHSLSHYCAIYGVNHGQGCGYFLPLSIRCNMRNDTIAAAYDKLATGAGFTGTAHLLDWLDSLSHQFNLAQGIPRSDVLQKQIVADVFYSDPTVQTNPVGIDLDTVFNVMHASDAV